MQGNCSRRQLLISAGLVILVIVLLLALVDVGAVVEMQIQANWWMLLLATAFLLLAFGFTTLRTRYVLGNRPGFLDTQGRQTRHDARHPHPGPELGLPGGGL